MKHLLSGFTLAALASVLWVSAAPQQSDGYRIEDNLYTNTSLGFTFQFPATWVVREVEGQAGTTLRGTPPNSDLPGLVVFSSDLSDSQFVNQVLQTGQGYLATERAKLEDQDFEMRGNIHQVAYANILFYRMDFRSRGRRNRTYQSLLAAVGDRALISFRALGRSTEDIEAVLKSLETVTLFDPVFAAWEVVVQTTVPEEVIRLGKDFLVQFPESALAASVHKRLAISYRQLNDYENVILHAEKALELSPDDLEVRPMLALVFAERGENNRAIDYSQQGLELLETTEKPADNPVGPWTRLRYRAMADANYAQGLAYLKKSLTLAGDPKFTLERSVEYLEKAAESEPEYDRAYFRLGDAYSRLNDAEKAIQSYARAIAANGIASELAAQMLPKIYEALGRDVEGIGQVTQEQREYIEQELAEREAHIQQLEAEEEQRLQRQLEQQEQLLQQQQQQQQEQLPQQQQRQQQQPPASRY